MSSSDDAWDTQTQQQHLSRPAPKTSTRSCTLFHAVARRCRAAVYMGSGDEQEGSGSHTGRSRTAQRSASFLCISVPNKEAERGSGGKRFGCIWACQGMLKNRDAGTRGYSRGGRLPLPRGAACWWPAPVCRRSPFSACLYCCSWQLQLLCRGPGAPAVLPEKLRVLPAACCRSASAAGCPHLKLPPLSASLLSLGAVALALAACRVCGRAACAYFKRRRPARVF
jgi:hypothetical protein